jgi:NAD(P)-dependent dehydrogenase (short-subunit alcohol dehydrogenase family)
MTRGILLAGIESPLAQALGAEAARRVERYAAALIPSRPASRTEDAGESSPAGASAPPSAVIPLEWNPASPISARSLVLAAENRLEHIDIAILVCAPPALRRPPEQLAPADIEYAVNAYIKGWFFLVRELAASFAARREGSPAGTLVMALADRSAGAESGENPDLLGPPVAASFRALAQGLLTARSRQPGQAGLWQAGLWQACAFSSDLAEDRDFAAFIFKTLFEGGRSAAGKWHKYGKFPFFGR